eukprot:TRINITY_DN44408_c0_g1_i1.p1 TRINITY_DN44408_c0_g1~~TRINITY_DN44408_c0_g1_i1.p1  ORF type:complete len:162 (+),score=57.97 TRINITY_DN44408_c0_g1_i1:76-561(+)
MKVLKDIVTGDELASDSYPMSDDGLFLNVKGKFVTLTDGDYGIAGEEGEVDSSSRTVIDIVDAFRLQELQLDLKGFQAEIKGTCQSIKTHLEEQGKEEEAAAFQRGVVDAIKGFMPKVRKDELSFYKGESMAGQLIIVEWDEVSGDPVFKFFKAGVKEEKF